MTMTLFTATEPAVARQSISRVTATVIWTDRVDTLLLTSTVVLATFINVCQPKRIFISQTYRREIWVMYLHEPVKRL